MWTNWGRKLSKSVLDKTRVSKKEGIKTSINVLRILERRESIIPDRYINLRHARWIAVVMATSTRKRLK